MIKKMSIKTILMMAAAVVLFAVIFSCGTPLVNSTDDGILGDVLAAKEESGRGSIPPFKYFRVTESNGKIYFQWEGTYTDRYNIELDYVPIPSNHYDTVQLYPNTYGSRDYGMKIDNGYGGTRDYSQDYTISDSFNNGVNTVVMDKEKLIEDFGPHNCKTFVLQLYHYSSDVMIEDAVVDFRQVPSTISGYLDIRYTSSSNDYIKVDFKSIDTNRWPELASGKHYEYILLNDDLERIYPTSYPDNHSVMFSTSQILDVLSSGTVAEIGITQSSNDAILRRGKIDLSKDLPTSMGNVTVAYSSSSKIDVKLMFYPPAGLGYGSVTRVMSAGGVYAQHRWAKYGIRIYKTSYLKSLNNNKRIVKLRLCSKDNLAVYTDKDFAFWTISNELPDGNPQAEIRPF